MLEASRTPEPRDDIVVTKFWQHGAIQTQVSRAFSRVSLTPDQRAGLVGRYGAKVVRFVLLNWRHQGLLCEGIPAFDKGVVKGGSGTRVATADVGCARPPPTAPSPRCTSCHPGSRALGRQCPLRYA